MDTQIYHCDHSRSTIHCQPFPAVSGFFGFSSLICCFCFLGYNFKPCLVHALRVAGKQGSQFGHDDYWRRPWHHPSLQSHWLHFTAQTGGSLHGQHSCLALCLSLCIRAGLPFDQGLHTHRESHQPKPNLQLGDFNLLQKSLWLKLGADWSTFCMASYTRG